MRTILEAAIADRHAEGYDTAPTLRALEAAGDNPVALAEVASQLDALTLRPDWPWAEPDGLAEVYAAADPSRATGLIRPIGGADAAGRARTAFLASVCGCILGKPLESDLTLDQIRAALTQIGEWPLADYVSERVLGPLPRVMPEWNRTYREQIGFVMPDDDLNYRLIGLMLLEQHGIGFDHAAVRDLWLKHLTITSTYGPERRALAQAVGEYEQPGQYAGVGRLTPGNDVHCGAMIRADAYGYACPGRPQLAADLAYRDATFTHRKTGVYGTMFAAAAIATAPVASSPLNIFEIALKYVPQRSRFASIASDALTEIARASDWLDGYDRLHRRYGRYGHCHVFQETGMLMNTLRFADAAGGDPCGDGICKQVMQGADTDSYGATAGSILGAYFGPDGLSDRWLRPFNDDFRTALAWFFDRSLQAVADRFAALPALVERQTASGASAAT